MADESKEDLLKLDVMVRIKRGEAVTRSSNVQIYMESQRVSSTNRKSQERQYSVTGCLVLFPENDGGYDIESHHCEYIDVMRAVKSYVKNSCKNKELHIRLTDENNQFFLFFLNIGEDEFQNLKIQQGLLIDFNSFPQKFIELVEMCKNDEKSNSPRFLLQFTLPPTSQGSGSLDVVEANPFKHLVHLSLKFLPAQDEEIKRYLAECLKKAKEEIVELSSALSTTQRELSSRLTFTEEQLALRTKELQHTKEECTNKIDDIMSRHMSELSTANAKGMQIQDSYEMKMKRERQETETKYRDTINDLEKRLSDAQSGNEYLAREKSKLESRLADAKKDLVNMNEDLSRMKDDFQSMKRHNTVLDGDKLEKDKILNHLRTRIAVLEQEVKNKDMMLVRTSELAKAESEQKRNLEEELKEKRLQTNKLDVTVKSLSSEILKGNEIIHRLQNEIKNLHSQIKLKNKVTTRQESIIEEKISEITENTSKIKSLSSLLEAKDSEVQKLHESLEDANRKLSESQEQVKTNENVITWLNKQLNEQSVNTQRHAFSDPSMGQHSTQSSIRLPAQRLSMVHSTPSGPLPASYTAFGQPLRPQRVQYLPPGIRRAAAPRGLSPLADELSPVTGSREVTARQPLRPRQAPEQSVQDIGEPFLDPKYLGGISSARQGIENARPPLKLNEDTNPSSSKSGPLAPPMVSVSSSPAPFPVTLKIQGP